MKDVVIFDIDGTLANGEHRQHYVRKEPGVKKNWPRYMELLHLDTVHEHVRTMYLHLVNHRSQMEGPMGHFTEVPTYQIYIVSGRDETYRSQTQEWLHNHGITGYMALYMRQAKDYRADDIVKEEIFNANFADKKDRILCVFDDRPRVIRMWRKLGIPVFDCGYGIEF
jgi:FMN phosphatase YigB (HAD superfamily)